MKKESRELFIQLFGQDSAKILLENFQSREPELLQLLEEVGMDRIWARKGLPRREQRIITLASQASIGRWDQVELHMKGFLEQDGGTPQDVRNIFFHLGLYVGFPAIIAGLKILRAWEDQQDKSE